MNSLSTLSILGIAFGLAMDALAVAMATGIALGRVTARQTFRLSFHFGLFQFMMPILGWSAGLTVGKWISAYDHWLAFALLGFIGGKMVFEAINATEKESPKSDPTRGMTLISLSIATSIDAMAVGVSLGVMRIGIWYPAIVIGLVAASLTTLGIHVGRHVGERSGERMEIAGGIILWGIGLKILVEHLTHRFS